MHIFISLIFFFFFAKCVPIAGPQFVLLYSGDAWLWFPSQSGSEVLMILTQMLLFLS